MEALLCLHLSVKKRLPDIKEQPWGSIQPAYTCSIRLILPRYIKDFNLLQIQLMNKPGVHEVMFDHNALSAYIKIDKKIISRHKLETIINNQ